MVITFLGATHEVTGSCTMLEAAGKKFLIDCGMEQGRDMFENQSVPVSPAELDFILLTHAHVDHSGNLPLLVKHGFGGEIYATSATCELCRIMLLDCAHIQESEAEYTNRRNKRSDRSQVEPLYDSDDVEKTVSLFRPEPYGQTFCPADGIRVSFTDIGHLLGSAAISVTMTEDGITKTMVFSGDVGNTDQPIIRDPSPVSEADYLLLESTYGDRLHDQNPAGHVDALAAMIQRTFDRGGNVIIPSFAVGRTQEMLYFIREIKGRELVKGHDHFRVVVDSPALVVVVHRHAERLLGRVLPDDVLVEHLLYLRGGLDVNGAFVRVAHHVLVHYLLAQKYAFVADEHAGAGDQAAHLRGGLAAERAARFFIVCSHFYLLGGIISSMMPYSSA